MGRIYLKAEDLQKFWDEHQSECSDNFLKISHYYGYENDSKRYSGLEVSGVSRLVTVYVGKIRLAQLFQRTG